MADFLWFINLDIKEAPPNKSLSVFGRSSGKGVRGPVASESHSIKPYKECVHGQEMVMTVRKPAN